MKYEKPVVTLIDLGAEDVITSSLGETSTSTVAECDTTANQWTDTCHNTSHQTKPCKNKNHKGE